MKENKMELLLHPIRFQLVQEFMGGEKLTAKHLAEKLPHIPQATLYRHLDKLMSSQILLVVEEKQIRGTIEKLYVLNGSMARMSQNDIKDLTKEEHMQYFMMFITGLTAKFKDYLQQEEIDFEKDGTGYTQASLYMSDEEFLTFVKELNEVFMKAYGRKPSPERRRRTISTIIIPEKG
ncbi:helix-turn-helix domain-containing protein [Bacillus sp. DX4.1]|uniref:helix-turn-helix domain-containing protein n=1 Tax=Bacillus sp. DX4.1 TaxID=3055867 RepID=UPI0025A24E32|nr:helix-turn-helix domain-containing protein [Bacillus sp. DX4.1]MDM5187033.1 helix-turn-helix domain-containing protein [Bacillus sp. DX4.1]